MQHTQKEILEALELIKATCFDNQLGCENCPFYSIAYQCCNFRNDEINPSEWELNSPDKTWHAVF
jgi:hypothetical protein